MAIYKEDIVDIELETGKIQRSFLTRTIGMADNQADRFGVRVFRNGSPVELSGVSVQGYFRNSHGENIAITSNNVVSGNVAEVVLPQACYNYDGQFCLAIKLVGGGVTGTMRIVDGVVDNTNTTSAVAPTNTVPTYQEVIAQYDAMVAATLAANQAIAPLYADLTFPVYKGDYCIYNGALKRAKRDIEEAETWTSGHWATCQIGPDLKAEVDARIAGDSELKSNRLSAASNDAAAVDVGDMNLLTTPGNYKIPSISAAQSILNTPIEYSARIFVIQTSDTSSIFQLWFTNNTAAGIYYRRKFIDSWNQWQKITSQTELENVISEVETSITSISGQLDNLAAGLAQKVYTYELSSELTQFVFDVSSLGLSVDDTVTVKIGFGSTYKNTAIKDRLGYKSGSTLPIQGNGQKVINYATTANKTPVNNADLTYLSGTYVLEAVKYIGIIVAKATDNNTLVLNGGTFSLVEATLTTGGVEYDIMPFFQIDKVYEAWSGSVGITPEISYYSTSTVYLDNKSNQKTMAVIGDSISVGYTMIYSGSTLVSSMVARKWWEIIKDRYNLSTVDNISAIGACFTIDGTSDNPRFTARLSEIPNDTDIIVVFGGTNDYERNRQIGNLTDAASGNNDVSFVAAVKYTFAYLTEHFPNSIIIVITPLQRNYTQGFDAPNAIGKYLYEYIDILEHFAKVYGVYIDNLYDTSGFHMYSADFMRQYCCDGLHPTTEGTVLYTNNGIIPVFDKLLCDINSMYKNAMI